MKREALWQWASEKSTITGFVGAVVMIAGWHLAPERMDAIATVTTTVSALMLAIVRER